MTAARPEDRGSCSGATPYVFRALAETTACRAGEIAARITVHITADITAEIADPGYGQDIERRRPTVR